MKFHFNLNIPIIILSFGTFIVAGCQSGVTNTPNITATTTSTLVSMPTVSATVFPFSGKIAYLHSTNDLGYYSSIYVMNANGSEVNEIAPMLAEIGGLTWSPDGEYLAFHATIGDKSQVFKMIYDSSDLNQLTTGEDGSYSPSWSPDGKYIIFLSSRTDILDYRGASVDHGYIMKSDGTGLHRLQDENKLVVNGLSYRGDNLISVSVPATVGTIRTYTINSDGVIQKQFPEFTIDGLPVWSPNGEFVVFSTVRVDCSGIVVMQSDGSNQQCLIIDGMNSPPVYVSGVSWSPDSKHIIFSSNLDGDYDIYAVMLDGSGLIQLTNMPGDELEPAWSSLPPN